METILSPKSGINVFAMKTLAAAFAVALAAVGTASATNFYWKPSDSDPAGVLTNAVHFYSDSSGTTSADPATITAADNVRFTGSASSEFLVTMPSNHVATTAYGAFFVPGERGSVKVDLSGAVWRQPDLASDASVKYNNENRLRIRARNSSEFLYYSFSGNTACGAFVLSNAVFRLASDELDNQSFDLDQGLFDCYSPNGANRDSAYLYAMAVTEELFPSVTMRFHEGSCARFPNFLVYARSSSNEIVFDGGDSHYMLRLRVRGVSSTYQDTVADRTKLIVTGEGTKLTLGEFGWEVGNGDHRYRVTVKDGAELAIQNTIKQLANAHDRIEIINGATLRLGKPSGGFIWSDAVGVISNSVVDSTGMSSGSWVEMYGKVQMFESFWRATRLQLRGSSGSLYVNGGGLSVPDGLVIANGGTESAELVLDGGEHTAGGYFCLGYPAGSTGTLAMSNGCVLTVLSRVSAASGAGRIIADGGTLRASAANDSFIGNLATVACGANGLTIDSDYDVTVLPSFSNMSGAAGELILAGSGNKTISGASTTVSRIVVAGGTVVFAAAARATSELVVTNGAKVVFAGDPYAVGLTSLVLGDASTAGVLQFSSGQSLAIAGDVTVNNARVVLADDFAIGTTTDLLSASGTVSAASRTAWAAALVGAGAVDGRDYEFEAVESGGGGVSLRMAVTEAPIRLIEQKTGTRDYADDYSFNQNARLTVAVSNDASLTVSGCIGSGGLDKVGGGKFYLTNGSNSLRGGITSSAGLFSVPSVAALGYDVTGLGTFLLGGGTLEFTSASSETYPGTIIVDAGANRAVVVKNASDVTVSGHSSRRRLC